MKNHIRVRHIDHTDESSKLEFDYPRGSLGQGASPMVVDGKVVVIFSWFEPSVGDQMQVPGGRLVT